LWPNKKTGGLLFLKLPRTDPGFNLAVEEYFLDGPDAPAEGLWILLVYENSESVIIGKNQNPWKEIALPVLRRGKPRFFRRISGGGAVWHGQGNLNFSFITPRNEFSKEENLDFVRRALGRLGVSPERTDRGDLVIAGKKISGNALCYRKNRVLHHGTILVNAGLEALRSCLPPADNTAGSNPFRIETRGVPSFPMPVANLADFAPGATVSLTIKALFEEARGSRETVSSPGAEALPSPAKLADIIKRHDSREWLYGAAPAFTCRLGGALLTVKNGCIAEIAPSENPADAVIEIKTAKTWLGKPFGIDAADYFWNNKFFNKNSS
jgi:lipoate-protein ligase A